MQKFCEDEDFVAVRRVKRKNDVAVSDEQNSSTVEKKRRKFDDKDGKRTDVDFVDRSILKNIRVPKKIIECDDPLQRINLLSKEFSREVNDVILRSLKDGQSPPYEVKACYLIQNRQLLEKYSKRRSDLKGDAATGDSYGFCFFREFAAVREIAKNGLRIGNIDRSFLGTPENGVCLIQYADVVAQPQQLFGWIIICKYMKGRVNYVQMDENPLEPQPGYQCHISQKNSQSDKSISPFYSCQVYLYEYSEDFELMDYPSHILPIAAIQIAAKAVNGGFKKKSFEDSYRSRLPTVPVPHKAHQTLQRPVADETPKNIPDLRTVKSSDDLSCKVIGAKPEPKSTRSVPHLCVPHSSGGIVVGCCLLRIPLPVCLEAETLIISFFESNDHLPFGISMSVMTLNRFIDLEDLYTTIFRDGMVKLSLGKEVYAPEVGYFSYYRVVLKDGCSNKAAMINFANFLKATNKACLLVSHLENVQVLLFPDAQVARDIGLPQPDPLAQLFSLHCVILAGHSRRAYYERMVSIPGAAPEGLRAAEEASSPLLHHRMLRQSLHQQAEAQRHYFRQTVDKAAPASVFRYKPLVRAETEGSPVGEGGAEAADRGHARRPRPKASPRAPAPDRGERREGPGPRSREEEDDDIDDVAVLDSIDKMVLEETSSKAKAEVPKPRSGPALNGLFKEVFHDPPASPTCDPKMTRVSLRPVAAEVPKPKPQAAAPVVEAAPEARPARAGVDAKKEACPSPRPASVSSVIDSVETQIRSLVSSLKSRMGAPAQGPSMARALAAEKPAGTGEEAQPDVDPGDAKTIQDWYWFYHSQLPNGKSADGDKGGSPAPGQSPRRSPADAPGAPLHAQFRPRAQDAPEPPPERQPSTSRGASLLGQAPGPVAERASPSSHLLSNPSTPSQFSPGLGQDELPPYRHTNPPPAAKSGSYGHPAKRGILDRPPGPQPQKSYARPGPALLPDSRGPPGYDAFSLAAQESPRRQVTCLLPTPPRRVNQSQTKAGDPFHDRHSRMAPGYRQSSSFSLSARSHFESGSREDAVSQQLSSLGQPRRSPSYPADYGRPRCSEEISSSRDVDLRTVPTVSPAKEDPNLLNSMGDVDMRVLPSRSRASVYQPRSLLSHPPSRQEPSRPVSRISTYDPGFGFH